VPSPGASHAVQQIRSAFSLEVDARDEAASIEDHLRKLAA
jgi:hypothetical protein